MIYPRRYSFHQSPSTSQARKQHLQHHRGQEGISVQRIGENHDTGDTPEKILFFCDICNYLYFSCTGQRIRHGNVAYHDKTKNGVIKCPKMKLHGLLHLKEPFWDRNHSLLLSLSIWGGDWDSPSLLPTDRLSTVWWALSIGHESLLCLPKWADFAIYLRVAVGNSY